MDIIGVILVLTLLIPGRILVQAIHIFILMHKTKGHCHVKWNTLNFYVLSVTMVWPQHFGSRTKKKKGVGRHLLRIHNEEVHTRRNCYREHNKKGRLVEYRLNFKCSGGSTSLLAYRQYCIKYSVNFWSKLGPVNTFVSLQKEKEDTVPCQVDYSPFFCFFFVPWYDPKILALYGFL